MRDRGELSAGCRRDAFILFGWIALFDALIAVNDRDPQRRPLSDGAVRSIAEYVGVRRDALLEHNFPHFVF